MPKYTYYTAYSTNSQDNTVIQRLPNSEVMNIEKNLMVLGPGLLYDRPV